MHAELARWSGGRGARQQQGRASRAHAARQRARAHLVQPPWPPPGLTMPRRCAWISGAEVGQLDLRAGQGQGRSSGSEPSSWRERRLTAGAGPEVACKPSCRAPGGHGTSSGKLDHPLPGLCGLEYRSAMPSKHRAPHGLRACNELTAHRAPGPVRRLPWRARAPNRTWEIKMKSVIDLAADRGAYIAQNLCSHVTINQTTIIIIFIREWGSKQGGSCSNKRRTPSTLVKKGLVTDL